MVKLPIVHQLSDLSDQLDLDNVEYYYVNPDKLLYYKQEFDCSREYVIFGIGELDFTTPLTLQEFERKMIWQDLN